IQLRSHGLAVTRIAVTQELAKSPVASSCPRGRRSRSPRSSSVSRRKPAMGGIVSGGYMYPPGGACSCSSFAVLSRSFSQSPHFCQGGVHPAATRLERTRSAVRQARVGASPEVFMLQLMYHRECAPFSGPGQRKRSL